MSQSQSSWWPSRPSRSLRSRKERRVDGVKGRKPLLESLETRELLNVDWRNPLDHLDVNRDASLSPNDVLVIVNDLNRNGPRTLPGSYDSTRPYYDVNGDGNVTAQDGLNVINYLNRQGIPQRDVIEGGVYETTQELNVTVGQSSGSRLYRVRIEADFRGPQRPGLIPDWFSVYVVDPRQPSQTLLDRGVPGTSIFSLSPLGHEVASQVARWDGQILEIDLRSLANSDTARLRMQLLDGNGVASSVVRVRPVTNAIDPDRQAVDTSARSGPLVAAGGAVELTNWTATTTVEPLVRNVRLDPTTGDVLAEVSIRNRGAAMGRNVALRFPALPQGVVLQNASGVDAQGRPYINLQTTIRSGGLAMQSESETVEVRFTNPTKLPLSLVTEVLVGAANRAPELPAIAPQTVVPGESRVVTLNASDPDGDRLSYTVRAAAGTTRIPTLRVDSSLGQIILAPTPEEIGNYSLEVLVSDGVASQMQPLELQVVAEAVGTTRVSGQILEVDGAPIPGMVVEIGAVQATTGSDGRFLLDLGSGPAVSETIKVRGDLFVDAQQPDVSYPFIAEKLPFMLGREVYTGYNNVLGRPIYLPRLNPGTPVTPTQDSTIQAPLREDTAPVVVQVAAGSLLTQQGTPFTGNLSVTEVPVERTPAALPPDLLPDFLITIQPGEMNFSTPAPLSFPNTGGWAPGTLMDLWSINPTTGEFEIVGQMVVSSDGLTINTIEGGIRNSSWHFPAPPPPEPRDPDEEPNNKDDECNRDEDCQPATSTVALHSGAVLESHELVSYQSQGITHAIRLHYNSQHADPRPIVHFGFDNTVANADERFVARLSFSNGAWTQQVPGFAGGMGLRGGEHFWQVPPEGGSITAALQGDLRSMPSGYYQYTLSSGLLRLNDGRFTGTMASSRGQVVHVNAIDSAVGAGWQIGVTQRLIRHENGNVLLLDGKGLTLGFKPLTSDPSQYTSPAGDFSQLKRLPDGSYQRTMPDQTVLRYAADGYLQSSTDRNGNQTRHLYEGGRLTKIIDPVGLETTFTYTGSKLSSITDPAGRVTRLEHDASGNLTRIIDPDGSSRQFSYDADHRLIAEIDQRGSREETRYGFHGRAIESLRKDGSTLQFSPLQTQLLLPPDATINPLAPPLAAIRPAETVVQTTQANGQILTTVLDQAGQMVTREDALGSMSRRERNRDNLLSTISDARGNSTSFSYDSRGNITSTVDSLSSSSIAIVGEIDVPGATREYRFSIQEDTQLYIDSLLDNWNFNWTLSGPAGVTATGNLSLSQYYYYNSGFAIPAAAGDYVLKIQGLVDTVGEFQFRLLDLSAALPLTPSSSVLAAFDPANSALVYALEAVAGQRYRVDFSDLNWNVEVRVIGPYGTTAFFPYELEETITIPQTGTYTIILDHAQYEPSDEIATVRFAVYPVEGNPSDPWTGSALTLGTTVSGTVATPGAEQHYLFTLDSARQLYFDSQTNSGNLHWTLEGPAGVLVEKRPFNRAENELISSAAAGAYRLTVSGFQANVGNYRFALHDLAGGTTITPGTAVTATLDPANAALLYRFPATAGDRFFFDDLSATAVAATWQLLNPYGKVVFNQGFGDVDTQTMTRTGVYTLIINGLLGATTATELSFNVQPAGTTTLPPWTGEALTLGSTVSGTIATAGAQQHYLFNLDSDRSLFFDSLGGNGGMRWTLEGPAGVLVNRSQFNNSTFYWYDGKPSLAAVAGEYRLTVEGSVAVTGSYAFRLLDLAAATPLTPGTPVDTQLDPASETLTYRFNATAGERYYFDVQSGGDYSTTWGLIDSFGNRIFDFYFVDFNTVTLPRSGIYTLVIDGHPNDTNARAIRFNVQPVVDNGTTALSLGTPIRGSIGTPGAEQHYTFTLNADSKLLFDTLTDRSDLLWTLEGPAGIAVYRNSLNAPPYQGPYYPELTASQPTANAAFYPQPGYNPVLDAVAGTYRLSIAAAEDATGDFVFRMLDLAAPSPISLGVRVDGTLNPANSTTLYRFNAEAGQRLYFDQHPSVPVTATWQLVDPFGRLIFDAGFGDRDTLEVPFTGNYTLAVTGVESAEGTAPFSFTIQPVPDGPATPILLNSTVSGSLPTAGFERAYNFTLDTARQLAFDNLTDSWDLHWTLEGPSGVLMQKQAFNYPLSSNFLSAVAGTYRLTIGGHGDTTGDFQFRLLDRGAATPLALGSTVEGALNPANSTRLYRFAANAGDRIYLDVRSTEYVNANWTLVDPYGALEVGSSFVDIDTHTLKRTGSYTLVIEGNSSATGAAAFAFQLSPVLSLDPTALTLGETVRAAIETVGAENHYSFTLDTPRLLYFDNIALEGYLTWTLEGPGGIYVDHYQFATLPSDGVVSARAGTYRLTIEGAGDSTGDYQFRLLDLSAAPLLTPGTPVSTTLAPASSTAIYQVDVDAGEGFFFNQLNLAQTPAQVLWLDPYGKPIHSGVYADWLFEPRTQAGTYSLLIDGFLTAEGSTPIDFNLVPIVTPAPVALNLNEPTLGSIENVASEQRYTFTLDSDRWLYFDARTDSTVLYWSLEGPSGHLINRQLFYYEPSQPVLSAVAGTYELTIGGLGDATGDYQFALFDLAAAVPLTPGTPIATTLNPANSAAIFQFAANAGDQFFFDESSPQSVAGTWRLVDPYGTVVFYRSLADVETQTLTRSGSYTLILDGAVNENTTAAIEFTIQPVGNETLTPWTGDPLNLNETVSGSIGTAGAEQYYLFTLPTNRFLYFDSLTNTSALTWKLEGPAGTLVDHYSLNGNPYNPAVAAVAGEYRLTIDGVGDQTGDFAFRLLDLATSTPLTPGTPIDSTLSPGNSTNVYRFTATAGERFYFDERSPNPITAAFTLIDPYGNLLFSRWFSDIETQTLPRTGSYTLLVEGWHDNQNDLDIGLNVQPVVLAAPEPLSFGTIVNASVTTPGDERHYSFSLDSDRQLVFDLQNRFTGLLWSLSGPTGTLVDRLGDDRWLNTPTLQAVAGQYRLTISGASDSTGDFSFQMLDTAAATILAPGNVMTGTLAPGSATNLYRFTAQAGERFYFQTLTPDSLNAIWKLVDPYGRTVFDRYYNYDDVETQTLAWSGSYSLIVEGNEWTTQERPFSFQVHPVLAADSIPLTLGATLDGTLATVGAEQQFTFALDANKRLLFDSLVNEPALYWSLEGPAGTLVSSRPLNAYPDSPLLEAVAGNYRLTVRRVSGSSGDYRFRLLDLDAAQPIVLGAETDLTVTPPNGTFLYRFDATAGDQFFLDLQTLRSVSAYWRVLDPYGRDLFYTGFVGRSSQIVPSTGTYTLVFEASIQNIESVSGTFTIYDVTPTAPIDLALAKTQGTRFTYDETFSQLTSVLDELGRLTLIELDPLTGNRLEFRQVVGRPDLPSDSMPDDMVTRFTYTSSGQIASETDPLGRVTRYTYDALGRVTSILQAADTPAASRTQFEYDAAGNRTAVIDPNGQRTTYEYDLMNRLTRVILPDPDELGPLSSPVTLYAYDPRGNLLESTDAEGSRTQYAYDPVDRRIRTTDTLGQVTQFTYDNAGNLTSVLEANGNLTRYDYDARNRRTRQIDANGGVTLFRYDTDNNLIGLTDAAGNQTRFEYDARRRLTREIDPLGAEIRSEYDAVNNLISQTDRNGRTIRFQYDDLNRLQFEYWVAAAGSVVNTIVYEYDLAGNLLSVIDTDSVQTWTYDELNRVVTFDNAGTAGAPSVSLDYEYDASSNLLSVTDGIDGQTGATTQYSYDALNRVRSLQQTGTGVTPKLVDLVFNQLGQIQGISRYGNTDRSQLAARSEYRYDDLNRLISLEHGTATSARELAFYDFEYDLASRITALTDIDGRTTFSYDRTDQLTRADRGAADERGDESYRYDANGNRTSSHLPGTNYTYGPGNRLLSDGIYEYAYDGEGNLIRRTDLESDAYRVFDYDHRNRLVRVTDFSAGGIALQQVDMTYDASDRRIAKTVDADGAGSGVPTTEHYVYDDEQVILEFVDLDGPGSAAQPVPVVRNLFGPGIDMILAQQQIGTSDTRWLLTDHLGTVRDLVSNTGLLLNHLQYDSFGNLLAQSVPAIATRYGFTGRELDTSLGLYYYRARYYSPVLGQFLSEDPVRWFAGDTKLFRYVHNNPIEFNDPFGLWFGVDDLIFAGGGAVIGMGGRLVGDLLTGSRSSWEDYAAAAVGGAVAGETLLYTANPFLAGAAGGLTGNLTSQGLKNLTGKQCGFDAGSAIFDTGFGAATGFIPGRPRIPGVNMGRGSDLQVFRQVVTKASNGTINSIKPQTAVKMFRGAAYNYAVGQGAAAGAVGSTIYGQFGQ